MIIGSGDIAEVLREIDTTGILYFASGVSNSQETRKSEYQREIDLLMKQDKDVPITYFSSLCVFDTDSIYANHKREMEKIIQKYFDISTIVRIGNITWGSNPHTLINFIRNKIRNKEEFEIKDVYRYIVDKDEFLYWVKKAPKTWSCEMNIPGQRLKVAEIVEKYGYIELHHK